MEHLLLWQDLESVHWARAAFSLAIVALLIPATLPLARRWGLLDNPGGRKDHACPVPVTGGAVILLAVVSGFFLFEPNWNTRVATFLGGAMLLVVVGQLDDKYDLRWTWRIAAQGLAAVCLFFFAGVGAANLQDVFGFMGANIGLLSLPFTVFVVVGIINALNMADGVDGLAGSLALVSLMLFTCFALYAGDMDLAVRLLSLAAAVVGFLLWNARWPWQPRARVFLGNGGSMLLGFIIAWAALRLTQNPAHPVSPVLGPYTLALPLIDCVVLMVRRFRRGASPFRADRNHMHHLLLDAGYRPALVVALMAGGSLALGIAAALAVKLGVYRPVLVGCFLMLLLSWYLFTRKRDLAVARLARLRGATPPLDTTREPSRY
ncbi:MAG TPA: MraY family glycosyltransferase [Arenimonas sp.]|nr:MraY family glycosyltransferase [Arenimonas sp.]